MTERVGYPKKLRTGFTLLELLTVIALIALLIALILPAVVSVRESARKAQCAANLRQIGLAMTGYEADNNMFPPSYFTYSATNKKDIADPNDITFFVRTLPYLEMSQVYNSVNFSLHTYDSASSPIVENRTARSVSIQVYLCPSDFEPHHGNSYRLNTGRIVPSHKVNGPFFPTFLPRVASIPRGLSRTAFLSEGLGGSYLANSPNPLIDMKVPINRTADTAMDFDDRIFIPYCLQAPAMGWHTDGGRYWFYFEPQYSAYNHNGSPNDNRPTCGGFCFGLLPPRSRHSGSVQVLFGDGHVESISNSIDSAAWRALGNIGDSEY
jgi:prepilin-type processing-associated H-X9-DG protein/prepilin-type N-terminal cleavage/methylation domain-containing protein